MVKTTWFIFLALVFIFIAGCTQIIYIGANGEYFKVNTVFEDPKINWLQFRDFILQTYDGNTTPVEATGVTPAGPVKVKMGG